MELFSVLLAIYAGNSLVISEFPAQRSVTLSFDVFFDPHLNKRLCKQSWGWWFERPLCSLWRYCNTYSGHDLGHQSACRCPCNWWFWYLFPIWFPSLFFPHTTHNVPTTKFLAYSAFPLFVDLYLRKENDIFAFHIIDTFSNSTSYYSSSLWLPQYLNVGEASMKNIFNTLGPRQNGHHFADNTFKCIFLNMGPKLKFHLGLFLRVQLTTVQHWFR